MVGPNLTGEKTNKEVIELIDSRLREARGITFPAELEAYHKARLDALVAIRGYLSIEPPDQPFNFLSLIGIAFLVTPPIQQAENELSFEARSLLVSAGCIEEEAPEPTPTPVPLLPGMSLDNPVEAGGILIGSNGTETVVLRIVGNAWSLIQAENQFNDPPAPGNRFYMVSVLVAYKSGTDSLNVNRADYSVIGDNRIVYTPFGNSCGVVPDALGAELFPGGQTRGNVCFQIEESDKNFVLIHKPSRSFGGERRFLSLE